MAAIDYSIPGQIKSIEIEPPMNAMARVMQLRGLQEASQLNALKMQEYQQQVQERNALNRLMANKNIPYGSDAFYSALATEAPSFYEKIATGDVQRQQALAAKTEREEKTRKFQEDQRRLKREFGLRKIAGAKDYQSAVSLIERGVRTGEVDREEADDMLGQLHATGPNTDMAEFRSNVLTNLLPAKEALTAPYDIEKAGLGVSAEKQKLEADKFKFEAEQVDNRLKEFNAAFPALSITSEKDVEARIRAMADDKVLGPLSQRFGSLDATIARNVAEYKRDPINYIKRLSGVSAADILKAAEEKDKEAYFAHVRQAIANKTKPLSEEAFMASRRQISSAAVSAQPSAAEAPVSDATAPGAQEVQAFGRNVPRPVIDASAAVAPNAAVSAVSAEAARALAPAVAKEQAEYTVHPDAQAYYDLFAISKNQADKAMGDAIQRAHIKQIELQNKPDQLMSVSPGGVVIDKATGEVKFTAPAAPEKPEPKTEAQKNYEAAKDGGYTGTFADFLDQQRESADEREWRKAVKNGTFKGTFLQWKQALRPISNTINQPAPTITMVLDPADPTRMLSINAREYQGGSLGSPGVIGIAGKEPTVGRKQEAKEAAQDNAGNIIAQLRQSFDRLDQLGGITSTQNRAGTNVLAGLSSSGFGQATGRLFGTEAQSERNKIQQTRPLLMTTIMQAMGISAKQLDSNAELKLWLSAATDPTLDLQANKSALANLERMLTNKNAAAAAAPKPTTTPNAPAVGTVKDGYKFKGGNPADKNNWEKVK